jgi:hypothetical protein
VSAAEDEPWGLAAVMTQQSESVTQGQVAAARRLAQPPAAAAATAGGGGWAAGGVHADVDMDDSEAAAAAAAAGPLAAAMAAATGEDRGQIMRMLMNRISSGRRRRRSSLPTQGNQVTEDMVMSSLNLLSLGLHNLRQRLQQQQQQQQGGSVTLSRQECEMLEVILSAVGVPSIEYSGPPLSELQFAGSSRSSSSSSRDPLPGIIPSLSILSSGSTTAGAAAAAAAARSPVSAATPSTTTAAGPTAAAAAGGRGVRVSDDVSSCAKALLPLAHEVLGLAQGLVRPGSTEPQQQGSQQGTAGVQGVGGNEGEEEDGRKRAKAAAQVGLLWIFFVWIDLQPRAY